MTVVETHVTNYLAVRDCLSSGYNSGLTTAYCQGFYKCCIIIGHCLDIARFNTISALNV